MVRQLVYRLNPHEQLELLRTLRAMAPRQLSGDTSADAQPATGASKPAEAVHCQEAP